MIPVTITVLDERAPELWSATGAPPDLAPLFDGAVAVVTSSPHAVEWARVWLGAAVEIREATADEVDEVTP